MPHLALFRKYRSQSFAELSGQDHVSLTLRNALRTGRVAQAYLFCGPRGTGKTSSARIFAKTLNCIGPDAAQPLSAPPEQPCNVCALCRRITEGHCLDVMEMDAASNTGVDNIREAVIGKVDFAPVEGRRKVYIIDEVHKLSGAAFSALLKTLEEPPPHLVFVLATTDPHDVPATILSRCQRFDFRRIAQVEMVKRMQWICEQEQLRAEPAALHRIAEAADGSLRDALVILEQAAAYSDGDITASRMAELLGITEASALGRLAGVLLAGDVGGALRMLDELVLEGRDLVQLAKDMLAHVRALLIVRVTREPKAILHLTEEQLGPLQEQATSMAPSDLMRAARVLLELGEELKDPVHARLNWEIAMLRIASPQVEAGYEGLAARVRALEESRVSVPVTEAPRRATPVETERPPRAETVSPEPVLTPTPVRTVAVQPPVESVPLSAPAEFPPEPAPAIEPEPPRVAAREPSPGLSPPATVPPTLAPPPPRTEALTLSAFGQAWQQVLDSFRKERKMALHAVLVEAHPIAVEGDLCVLGLGSKFSAFHLGKIDQQKSDLAGRLSQVLGHKVSVEVRIHDGPPPAAERKGTAAPDDHDEGVREIVDLFGGKIVQP
jgi:DNA polymerase-3 subunit gamma/tau